MKVQEEREIVDYVIYFKTSGEEGGGLLHKEIGRTFQEPTKEN